MAFHLIDSKVLVFFDHGKGEGAVAAINLNHSTGGNERLASRPVRFTPSEKRSLLTEWESVWTSGSILTFWRE